MQYDDEQPGAEDLAKAREVASSVDRTLRAALVHAWTSRARATLTRQTVVVLEVATARVLLQVDHRQSRTYAGASSGDPVISDVRFCDADRAIAMRLERGRWRATWIPGRAPPDGSAPVGVPDEARIHRVADLVGRSTRWVAGSVGSCSELRLDADGSFTLADEGALAHGVSEESSRRGRWRIDGDRLVLDVDDGDVRSPTGVVHATRRAVPPAREWARGTIAGEDQLTLGRDYRRVYD